jgi:predicted RNA-binding protein YlxR (DUF448 family)
MSCRPQRQRRRHRRRQVTTERRDGPEQAHEAGKTGSAASDHSSALVAPYRAPSLLCGVAQAPASLDHGIAVEHEIVCEDAASASTNLNSSGGAGSGSALDLGDEDVAPEPETGPLRRCVATRERLPKERMIRFVVGPDRRLVPDLAARLPGRGIWLSASGDVLQGAGAQGDVYRQLVRAFSRAARGPVSVPPNLLDLLDEALQRRIGDSLGLARRAGQAIAGFEKAREWIRTGRARLVVQASDGSAAERARFLSGTDPSIIVVDPLPAEALGRIFARDQVVHIAVAPGRLADSLLIEAGRLAGLRRGTGQADRQATAGLNKEAGANG